MSEIIDQARRDVFKKLWKHYYDKVDDAPRIEAALRERGEHWAEDHVAFRCLPGENTGSHVLKQIFTALGYKQEDTYRFEEKKLNAFWMSPSDTSGKTWEASPKIFISEFDPATFSEKTQKIIEKYTHQINSNPADRITELAGKTTAIEDVFYQELIQIASDTLSMPPPWQRPEFEDYKHLQTESEYAAWTLLFGTQINHFTVSVQDLNSFSTILELYKFLEAQLGIKMNASGGAVKGTKDNMLEQISTMAVKLPYLFQGKTENVPYGFVEFAYRYPKPGCTADSKWNSYYQGFVPANANKIFESTFTKQ